MKESKVVKPFYLEGKPASWPQKLKNVVLGLAIIVVAGVVIYFVIVLMDKSNIEQNRKKYETNAANYAVEESQRQDTAERERAIQESTYPVVGMRSARVREICGPPADTQSMTTSSGTTSLWRYKPYDPSHVSPEVVNTRCTGQTFVFDERGILTTIYSQ